MKGPIVPFLAGIVVGVLVTIVVITFGLAITVRPAFWSGVAYGFGGGFGAVVAIGLLNALVSYADKLSSGRA